MKTYLTARLTQVSLRGVISRLGSCPRSAERGLLGQPVDFQWREWYCLHSNQICDIPRKGAIGLSASTQHRWRGVEYTIRPPLRSANVGNKVLSRKRRITCWVTVQRKSKKWAANHILVSHISLWLNWLCCFDLWASSQTSNSPVEIRDLLVHASYWGTYLIWIFLDLDI